MRKGLVWFFLFFSLLTAKKYRIFEADFYCSYMVLKKPPARRVVSAMRIDYDVKMYSDGDYLIVKGEGLKEGQTFLVIKKVKDCGDRGTIYKKTGFVKIVKVYGEEALARIEHSCQFMGIGDYLVTYTMPGAFEVEEEDITPSLLPPSDFEASFLLLDSDFHQIGESYWAVINRGKEDGVKKGDVFYVFRPIENSNVLKPIAKAVVIEAFESAAAVKIVAATDAVRREDVLFKSK